MLLKFVCVSIYQLYIYNSCILTLLDISCWLLRECLDFWWNAPAAVVGKLKKNTDESLKCRNVCSTRSRIRLYLSRPPPTCSKTFGARQQTRDVMNNRIEPEIIKRRRRAQASRWDFSIVLSFFAVVVSRLIQSNWNWMIQLNHATFGLLSKYIVVDIIAIYVPGRGVCRGLKREGYPLESL
jgi:hypothetical protein